jgi:hypothetical protein
MTGGISRNRHSPKYQWSAAAEWLAAREGELLPVPYFHVVFTLPAEIERATFRRRIGENFGR